jgi:hypothetical protein
VARSIFEGTAIALNCGERSTDAMNPSASFELYWCLIFEALTMVVPSSYLWWLKFAMLGDMTGENFA